jgi:hypothetical protein
MSDAQLLDALAAMDDRINRGAKYTYDIQTWGKGVMGCKFLHKIVIPAQRVSRKKINLYSCY